MSKKQIAKELVLGAAETVREGAAGFLGDMLNTHVPTEHPAELKKDFNADLSKLSNATSKDYELISGNVEGCYLGKVELAGQTYGMVQQHEKNVIGLVPWSQDLTGYRGKEIVIEEGQTRTVRLIEQDKERGIIRGLGD